MKSIGCIFAVDRQSEANLNGKGYSAKDERRILDVLGRGLLKEFPNPERSGCPGSDVLRRIAFHEMPLSEAEKWLDHLGSCSPCYGDFSQFRRAHELRRRRTLLAVAASVLIIAAIATWVGVRQQNNLQVARTVVVDLRNRSIARGTEPLPAEPPLEISRDVSRLDIYLPLGSGDGPYDIRVATAKGEPVFSGSGLAKIEAGITALRVDVNLSSASPGLYVLGLQKAGSEWNSYPVRVR